MSSKSLTWVVVYLISNKDSTSDTKVITEIKNLEKYDFETKIFNQGQFLDNVSYSFNIYMDELSLRISNLISKGKKVLEFFCHENIEGIVAHKHLIFDTLSPGRTPLIEGKDVKRFFINPPSNFLTWNTKEIHRTRPDYLWNAERKIVIQRISGGKKPLVCAIDLKKYKSFASTNNILLKEKYDSYYYFIAALINSDVLNWFYANNFSNNSTLTVNISKTYMDQLPIPEYSETVSFLSEVLHFVSKKGHQSEFEPVTNALIFNLYFSDHMKEKGIDVADKIEEDVRAILNKRLFKDLSVIDKENVVESLQEKWSHPDSEVRNRIKLFAVRSPEILKPILEN